MKRILRSPTGRYELRLWHERRPGEAALVMSTREQALAFARALPREGLGDARALLARGRPGGSVPSDDETRAELAERLAAGGVLAYRIPEPRLTTSLEKGDDEEPIAAAPQPPPREQKTWVAIELLDEDEQPVPNERYWLKLPDGRVVEGRLDRLGQAYVGDIDPGTCEIQWPDLDDGAWEGAEKALAGKAQKATWTPEEAAATDVTGPMKRMAWLEIELIGEDGSPVAGERYSVKLPDGTTEQGNLDARGRAYLGDIDPGQCEVRFPDLDKDAWEFVRTAEPAAAVPG